MENISGTKRFFITLISEQTIPNLQYIKEFDQFDVYIFLSTDKMEASNKSHHIQMASNIPKDKLQIIVISEESYKDIIGKLEKLQFGENDQIVINCTLGTKIMSIALFDFFRNNKNAQIFYTPINTNKYIRIPDESVIHNFEYNIPITEYFTCYGISVARTHNPLFPSKRSEDFLEKFLEFSDSDFRLVDNMRDFRNKGIKNIQGYEGLNELIKSMDYPVQPGNALSKYDVQYLTGGWFEEWVFYKIKEKYNLKNEQIALGVIVNATADNDLDVVFIKNNNLYVIECKTSLGTEYQQATLYKSGALIEKFGKAAKSYLLTLQDLRKTDGILKESIELRARQQNVKVFDRKDMLDFEKLNF